MPSVRVSIEGREELKAKFDRLGKAARGPALERAVLKGAEPIRDEANRRAPGPHIEAEISESSDLAAEVAIGPDKDHWYYRFFETGAGRHGIGPSKGKAIRFPGSDGETVRFGVDHPGMTAAPFLRPALDGRKDEATREVGEELRRGIEAVCG